MFHENGVARVVHNEAELADGVVALLADADERERLGAMGQALLADNRGALDRLLRLLEPLLERKQA
jgi:3-deoxy-D-manno-octulosonic-acid transferase